MKEMDGARCPGKTIIFPNNWDPPRRYERNRAGGVRGGGQPPVGGAYAHVDTSR